MLFKKYELTHDLVYKTNNTTMSFNEFDVDSSDFIIKVTRCGVPVNLEGAVATIAVIKPNKGVDSQFIDVVNTSNLYCDLKQSMKNLAGKYEAFIMISLKGEHISIGPVSYNVYPNKPFAQLDSSIVEDKSYTILQEILNKLQPIYDTELSRVANEEDRQKAEEHRRSIELLRVEAEKLRQNNEETRQNNENTRLDNEGTRVNNEKARSVAENKRNDSELIRNENESTRVYDESSRVQNEQVRIQNEDARVLAEGGRANTESNREANELQRAQAESDRNSNESQRVQNESTRQYFEEQRVNAENIRKSWYDNAMQNSEGMLEAESTREGNENLRVQNEANRVSNEAERVENETIRAQEHNQMKSEITEFKASITESENIRVANEGTRQTNETARQNAENSRSNSEASRQSSESTRAKAETTRLANETTRANNEEVRKSSESARVEAERVRVEQHQAREELLNSFSTQVDDINSKNDEQDNRLKDIEYKNKVQDTYISGLFNENNDKRLSIEGGGNSLKLEGSKKGLVEVERIVGNTLVNLYKNLTKTFNTNYIYGYNEKIDMSLFKPNTQYTTIVLGCERIYSTSICNRSATQSFYIRQLGSKCCFTTPSDFSVFTDYLTVYCYSTSSNLFVKGDEEKIKIIILEGDYTNKPIPSEYFEGMQSTFEECKVTQQMVDSGEELAENLGKYKCEVKVRGKNLFDKSKLLLNTLSTYGGYLYSKESDLTLTITDKNTNVDISNIYFGFSKDGSPSKTNWVVSNGAILLNGVRNNTFDNDKLMFVSFYPKTQNTIDKLTARFNIQLEEGTQATAYEPYFERTQTVYLNSPPHKGDEIVAKEDGLYHYHKMGKKIFDGNDTHGVYSKPSTPSGSYSFRYDFTEGVDLSKAVATVNLQPGVTWYNDTSSTCFGYFGNQFVMTLPTNAPNDYFKKKPITIIYPLAEPYYEKISDDKLLLEIPNDATLSVESVIPCQSISATYTGGIPSVYGMEDDITTLQDANVDIIATAWDTDYRLSEVEWTLEDNGLLAPMLFNINTKNIKGGNTMALTKFEQAKIMILGGAYNRVTLTKQLDRYLEKKVITQSEYDELIALMDAKELVVGD